jgi:hypothetical protein
MTEPTPVHADPFVQQLIAKLPAASVPTFTDEHLLALKVALGGRSWGAHVVDWRWTLSFWRWHYDGVLLFGRNRRTLTRREQSIHHLATAAMMLVVLGFCTLLGLLFLYLVKSALGIDLIDGLSFGVWDWFKSDVMQAL